MSVCRASALCVLVALATFACSPPPRSRAAGAVTTLAVRPVAWNPANVAVGKVRAVAESGDVVCVFADDGATVFAAKGFVAKDERARTFSGGTTLWAPDGTTPWLVGFDGAGRVQRLRGTSVFEDVTARYGLAGKRVQDATTLGPGRIAFLLGDASTRELALGSASKVTIYPSPAIDHLVGGGDFVAGFGANRIALVNAQNALTTQFTLDGVRGVALDDSGRLHASTGRALYAADATGALTLVYDAGHDGLRGLVGSGDHVWFVDRGELGVVRDGRVLATAGLGLGRDATLQPAMGGQVWVIDGGKLQRFEALLGAEPLGAPTERDAWSVSVAPVFARSCARCHQPNGISGADLSTEAAWRSKAELVRERVLVDKTMPPADHPLAPGDREAIAAWLKAVR